MFADKYKKILQNNKNIPKWKAFEYLCAIELNMLIWDDALLFIKQQRGISTDKDYGIDLISKDLTRTAQVKFYGETSSITWRGISTYMSYSSNILDIKDNVVVTTNSAKVAQIVKDNIKIILMDYEELYKKHIVENKIISLADRLNLFFTAI